MERAFFLWIRRRSRHSSKPHALDPRSVFRAIASAALRVLADTHLTSVVLPARSKRQMRNIVMPMMHAAEPITSEYRGVRGVGIHAGQLAPIILVEANWIQ